MGATMTVMSGTGETAPAAGFTALLRIREFRLLWLAAITCLLWALSGACTAYQIQVVAEFVHTISPSIRGQGLGIASAGLLAAQGIGLLAGGAITQIGTPTDAIVTAGAAATALGSALALTRRAHQKAAPNPSG